ncbi:serine hydrolase family protein [Hwanghaeella grinnelliae]|uniref:Serine hydrolase family protein n=1 Tax=Hwanghaeella grinnelliae TaxID=2500179 RepID=A0A3S2W7Q9_9PROT|nr:alpha/beta hydrolase [Hwanghaeella grinnelliae]RVU34826.1 serine hydrolase family protein [Hwanghaeella grinnelliae]
MAGTPDIFLLPGLGGSGRDHWQAIWADRDPAVRIVEQLDWDRPDPVAWQARLTATVGQRGDQRGDRRGDRRGGQRGSDRFVLVAHSLGCALAVRWALCAEIPPAAMMLVAPADVDSADHTPEVVRGFAPMPMEKLPCLSAVVASADDPYIDQDRAAAFAWAWGAVYHPLGKLGHLNGQSGIGAWAQGRAILDDLIAAVA